MTFLQPLLLMALPLIAMPFVIHLLNQRRHQTVEWAAMHFLRKAKRLNTGVAKLRYWLIMALRTAAVAGIILALSRPIATGWLGSIGTTDRAVFIVLDRSPSMELQDSKNLRSKREVALQRLDALFQTTSNRSRRFLVTTGMDGVKELSPNEKLSQLPEVSASAASTDLPGLLETVLQSIDEQNVPAVDIWICSDLQVHDWGPADGRWNSLKERLSKNGNARLLSLHYPARDDPNLAVSVNQLQRMEGVGGSELSMEIQVRQTAGVLEPKTVPVTIHLSGTRRTVELELKGTEARMGDVRIPLESADSSVAGYVELPPDANPADDTYHFVANPPTVQTALLVAESSSIGDLLELALSTPPDDETEVRLQRLSWSEVNEKLAVQPRLIVWQGDIGGKTQADYLERYLNRGGRLLLFPPEGMVSTSLTQEGDGPGVAGDRAPKPTDSILSFQGGEWQPLDQAVGVASWRTDSDLVRNTPSGESLPLGDIAVTRWFGIDAPEWLSLAKLENGKPLLSKRSSDAGSLYLCHSLPEEGFSNFAADGVCLYILLQRALTDIEGDGGNVGSIEAGSRRVDRLEDWRACDERSEKNLPWERWFQSGAYRNEEQVMAINRSVQEDSSPSMREDELRALLAGTGFQLLQDDTGGDQALAKEIWRVFVVLMILFLIGEAYLSLPSPFIKKQRADFVTLSASSAWQLPSETGKGNERMKKVPSATFESKGASS